jgi:hypothetical protein
VQLQANHEISDFRAAVRQEHRSTADPTVILLSPPSRVGNAKTSIENRLV